MNFRGRKLMPIESADPKDTGRYIYGVYSNGALTYIGHTANLRARLSFHKKTNKGTHYRAIKCKNWLHGKRNEYLMIAARRPIYNKWLPNERCVSAALVGGLYFKQYLIGNGHNFERFDSNET